MQNLSVLLLPTVILLVVSYLFGSISFSIILTKIFKNEDVREHGSGNAGMTNVLRTAGKVPAILTFVFDFLKCAVPVLVAHYIITDICVQNEITIYYANLIKAIVGLVCVIGHIFPVYFGFRGGKGVVTTAAMMAFVDWRVFLIVLFVFAVSFVIKKTVSISSICAAMSYPFACLIIGYAIDMQNPAGIFTKEYVFLITLVALCASMIVIVKHKDNIKRILSGTEKSIFDKKK